MSGTDRKYGLPSRPWSPAPWSFGGVYMDNGNPVVETTSKPIDGHAVTVAEVMGIDTACWEGVGDHDVNAVLIALAPEMAEALINAVLRCVHVRNVGDRECDVRGGLDRMCANCQARQTQNKVRRLASV